MEALPQRVRTYAARILTVVAVAAVYIAVGRVGLLDDLLARELAPLYPATGVALVSILVFGPWIWPGITIGAFLLNLMVGSSVGASAGIAVGETLAPLVAYLLLRRVGFRMEMDRLRDALALAFLAAGVGMVVSAVIGAGVLVLAGVVRAQEFWLSWFVWWTGDALGVLVITPLLLVIRKAWLTGRLLAIQPYRWLEMAALFAGTIAVVAVAMTSPFNLIFLVYPFLIWAAVRFQLAGATPCVLIAATLAIYAAVRESGPFAGHDTFTNMVTLQAFNCSAALAALVLAALIAERNRAYHEVEGAVTQLSRAVGRLRESEGLDDYVARWRGTPRRDPGRGAGEPPASRESA